MDDYYLMTPLEIARGLLLGPDGDVPEPERRGTPREELEAAVLPALQQPPCGVAFSGGRDSSLVLAVATHVARREGLPEPIPITRRFVEAAGSDESAWQELVIDHLGLQEWCILSLTDELELIGPIAQRHLRAVGVLWPPAVAAAVPLLERVGGGSLLDGEGGDEVLGVETHRIAPLTALVRRPRPVRGYRVRRAVGVLLPEGERRRRLRNNLLPRSDPYLRPGAQERFTREIARVSAARPLSYRDSVRGVPFGRSHVRGGRNRRLLAASYGVELTSPLLSQRFVEALAQDGGRLGRGDRTAVIRSIAGDLLPDSLVARRSKAYFNGAYFGPAVRRFADGWNGDGVDAELVDTAALRDHWCSDVPSAGSAALLQQAWLATQNSEQHGS